ncbi:MAG: HVO_0476 family zinc finger protein [Candidatus Methanomethylophilaceae archaeon]|jgi:uncharacterized Zn finger protein|nr:HVO_0476 family zinc finger protein [Candidatus Methanomethylophilaceae archaeon]NLF33447.1 hypothetical protein [Thermoplasmatales archaeon]
MREVPEIIYYECPDCEGFTNHEVLKGQMGRATLMGTFRCEECGRVFSGTIQIPEILKVGVNISDGPVTESASTEIESDDLLAVDDEFFLDDGRRVRITALESSDGRRSRKMPAKDIKLIWVKQYDVLSIKVSVNDGKRTYSVRVEAEPDDEFLVGMTLTFEGFDCLVHAIKARTRLVRRGSVEARDIVRVYGKIRRKTHQVLDLEEDDDFVDGSVDFDE